jgi:hypothetical protein
MKKQLYLGVILIMSLVICYACQKQNANDGGSSDFKGIVLGVKDSVFINHSDMKALVQAGLDSFHHQEILKTVDSIVSNEIFENSYILVCYHSNLGNSNILFKGAYQHAQLFATTTTKCEGSCDCKVQVVYDKDVTISCTCTSCALVTTQNAVADFRQLQSLCMDDHR